MATPSSSTQSAIRLCFDDDGDALLERDPFALITGMLLDQQMPMERAFLGPWRLAERLGSRERLPMMTIAAYEPAEFTALMSRPPAVHRFPAAMAGRIQALARHIVVDYAGDTEAVWRTVPTGQALYERILAMPGYGDQKSRILVALLGKQFQVQPRGWRDAAAPYGDAGSTRSVADVVDARTLAAVRRFKQEAKLARS